MKKDNSFANIFAIINRVNEAHSDTPVKRETEKFEKKISGKNFRPKHTRIMMREKTQDEYDKVAKEVKYKSFIGLDEYGKSNSAVGKYGISKDASITRFNKKKTAKNLFSYIPSCGYEIEIESPQYVSGTGDLKGFKNFLMAEEDIPQPMEDYYENLPDEYIEERLNGGFLHAYRTPSTGTLADYQENILSNRIDRDEEEKEFRDHIIDLVNKYHKNDLTEEEEKELISISLDTGILERIENVFYGKKYQYVMRALKEFYQAYDGMSQTSNTLDEIYRINENIIPIVRKQCANLKPYQQRYISSLIRDLTTYSSHEEIRDKYRQVFNFMMSVCVMDKNDEVTIEKIFDNFTMIVAPKYQAIVMAEISMLSNDENMLTDSPITLGEVTTLLRNYIEVLPTKVETLFLYLDKKYENPDNYTDVLGILPVQDWLKQEYPAIYAMLVDIGKRATQYAELFKDSKLD